MKQGILFDLDGTLWDSSRPVIRAWNRVLAAHGLRSITEDDLKSYMGKTIGEIAGLMLPALPHGEAAAILGECCQEEHELLRKVGGTLYPGLRETLAELGKSYRLFIVSNCQNAYMDAFFEAHGLRAFFDDFETNGRTGLTKAENTALLIRRSALDRAVFVGDTETDRDAAQKAGIPFVYAAYGFGAIGDAEYRIDRPWDLCALIDTVR